MFDDIKKHILRDDKISNNEVSNKEYGETDVFNEEELLEKMKSSCYITPCNNDYLELCHGFSRFGLYDELKEKCQSEDPNIYIPALTKLASEISNKNFKDHDRFLSNDFIKAIVKRFSRREIGSVRFDSSFILINLSVEFSDIPNYLLKSYVIISLIELISDQDYTLISNGLWALSNIVGDGGVSRDFVLSFDIFFFLQNFISYKIENNQVLTNLAFLILNLCRRYRDSIIPYEHMVEIFPYINTLKNYIPNENIAFKIAYSIYYIIDSSLEHAEYIINSGIISQMLKFFTFSKRIQKLMFRIVGNLTAYHDNYSQYLIDNNLNYYILPIMSSDDERLRILLYWLFSNIAAGGSRQQVEFVVNSNIMRLLYFDLHGNNHILKREACWVFANILYSSSFHEAIEYINNYVFIQFSNMAYGDDERLILLILDVLRRLRNTFYLNDSQNFLRLKFSEHNINNALSYLLKHNNLLICKAATTLLTDESM